MEPILMSRNVLSKGMNTNIYPSRLPADYCFELLNGKVYSAEGGNAYVVQNLKGNKEYFSISDGYSIIGLKEHKNILYIVSVNDDNRVEIGSYPSPKQMVFDWETPTAIKYKLDETQIGFENTYKPLPCIYGGMGAGPEDPPVYYNIIKGMRTEMFKFDIDRIIFPLTKSSNDNTVNIYLFDGENPNRTVNNCFDEDGNIILDRQYKGRSTSYEHTEYAVDRITRQFLSISKPPYARLSSVEEGGQLPLGNLFFYIRYLDYEFNKTNFSPLIGPVMISNGEDIFTVSGNNPDGNINKSNKRVVIDVNYIDMSYKYFEIAIAWKTSNDNVALGERAMLLTKRVPIVSDNEIGFTITGMEEMSELSMSEIIRPALKETSCMAATSFSDRFWGANWKESDYDKVAMKELAKRIYIEPELKNKIYLKDLHGDEMKDYTIDSIDAYGPSSIDKKYWYQSPEFVLDRIGYYRGEVYPFALVGILDDGTYTDPFPITGFDYYNAYELEDNLVTINDEDYLSDDDNTNNGFVRFPQFGTGAESSHIDDMDYIMLAKAHLLKFWDYLNEHITEFEGISGFKVVRGDRFKNLLYHGINLPMAESQSVPKQDGANEWDLFTNRYVMPFGTGQNREYNNVIKKSALSFPSIVAYPIAQYNTSMPYTRAPESDGTDSDIGYAKCYMEQDSIKYYRRSVFSPDYLFSNHYKLTDNQNCYIYYPYGQLPQWGSNWKSVVQGTSYYYDPSLGGETSPTQLSNSIYQYRFNYKNDKIGRISLENKLLFGISKYSNDGGATWTNYPITDCTNIYAIIEYFQYDMTEAIGYVYHEQFSPLYLDDDEYTSYDISTYDQRYIKFVATNVPKAVHRIKNSYSSRMGDGLLDNTDIGYLMNNSEYRNMGNRDITSIAYLGIDYIDDNTVDKDLIRFTVMMPILVYNQPNDASYYTDLVDRYKKNDIVQLFGIEYKESLLFIEKDRYIRNWYFNEKDAEGNNLTKYTFAYVYVNGDCFINRFSFRQAYNEKIYDLYPDDEGNPRTAESNAKHYNHGRLFSVVLQSDVNTSVRGQEDIGFYPLWASDWKAYTSSLNYNSVLCARFGGSLGIDGEDFIYDWGYSQTLPFNIIPGIDEIYKNDEIRFETRVRYTDKSFEEAYIDGWRSMYYLSKADYPVEYGAIYIIGYHGFNLIIVQDRAICQLFPDEKYVTQMQNQSGSEAVVGVGSILPDQLKKLSDFGSQHTAYIQTSNYLSAYDFEKSIWWKSGTSASGTSVVLGIMPISTNVSKFLIDRRKEIIDPKISLGRDEDENDIFLTVKAMIRKSYPAEVINGQTYITIEENNLYDINGFITIYDYALDEYFHYSIYDNYRGIIIIDQSLSNHITKDGIHLYINEGYTIHNHENISSSENNFISRVGFSPDIYGSFKNMLISNNRMFSKIKMWFHNDNEVRANYYGMNTWFKYGIVVSGVTEGITFNQMIFGSMMTVSDETPFSYIDYETEFQYTRHFPFNDEEKFWITPEYKENKWDFTVPECISGKGAGYEADSNMRGMWMKAMFVYKGNTLKFVGDVISKNIISNS